MSQAAEQRVDRVLLRAARLSDPAVTVEVCCVDGDRVGIEFALRAADAWHEHPDATVAVVTDAARFAAVVDHFERKPGVRSPWLLHLHERSPASPAARQRTGRSTITQRVQLRLDQPASAGDWTRWDDQAWTLQRLATRPGTRPSWAPRPRGRGLRDDLDFRTGVDVNDLEQADNLVADLWRLEWGLPFKHERARAEAARRLGIGAAEATVVIEALLGAQLLRWHDSNQLEVPSSWREGLLLPMRRVVLRLARQPDLTYPLDQLVHQHRRRFLGPMAVGAFDPELMRRVEHESRVESWRWIRSALLEHLGAVIEQTDWHAGGARWTLADSKFAADTVETAQQIRQRLVPPATPGSLETEPELPEQLFRPGRWLRCLRDVGLVRPQGDRWAWERGGDFHLR